MSERRLLPFVAAFLLVACTSGPPTPTASSRAPAPAPATPAPTATAAPSVLFEHPTGATDVLLRMQRTGGHLYPGTTLDVPATFTLYGDGTVLYTVDEALGGKDLRHGLRVARMNEEQMAALVTYALGAGGLADAAESYSDVPIADASTVQFEVDGAGFTKSVSVYALGDEMEVTPETAHREKFAVLAKLLTGFDDEIARGNATDVGPYDAEAYRVTLFPDEFGEFPPSADWPWDDLEPADFERDQSGFLSRVVTPAHAQLAADLAINGDIGDAIVRGPDEVNYLVRFRPLLPDEVP